MIAVLQIICRLRQLRCGKLDICDVCQDASHRSRRFNKVLVVPLPVATTTMVQLLLTTPTTELQQEETTLPTRVTTVVDVDVDATVLTVLSLPP
jgi:hypothetical protein